MALPFAAHEASLSDWLLSLPTAFLSRSSMFQAYLTSWGLHWSLGLTLIASHIVPSGAAFRDPDPVTNCMAS
jgi:hypothetical protein